MMKLFPCVGNSTARRTTSLDGRRQPSAAGQDLGRGHAAMPRLGRFALRAVGERMASCVAARTRCLGFVGSEFLAHLSSLAHQSWTRRVRGAVPHLPDHMACCPRRSTKASTARPVPQFAPAVLHACRGLGGKNKARGHRETTESRASNQCRGSRSSGPCQ